MKKYFYIISVFLWLCISIYFYYYFRSSQSKVQQPVLSRMFTSDWKVILTWGAGVGDGHGGTTYGITHGKEAFFKLGCEEWRCQVTNDRNFFRVSHNNEK